MTVHLHNGLNKQKNLIKKMQGLEFAFLLVFWEEMLQHFHRLSKALQNKHVNLKTCAGLYSSLTDHLHESRNEFERFEEAGKEITPGLDCKSTLTRNHKRKTVVIDGDAPEVFLNARDKFRSSAFYAIFDKLETEVETHHACSNSWAENHPYDGNINYVHVLSGIMNAGQSLSSYVLNAVHDFTEMTGHTQDTESLFQRCVGAYDDNIALFNEAYFADKNEVWCEESDDVWCAESNEVRCAESYEVRCAESTNNYRSELDCRMKDIPKRKVIPCRGYKKCLDELVDKAREYLRQSQSKSERRIHRNKLKIFLALKQMEEYEYC